MYKKPVVILIAGILLFAGALTPQFTATAQSQQPVQVVMIPAGSLTPGFLNSNTGGNIASAVYDYLFRVNDEGETVPSLASSYEISEDSTTWTMELQKGVTFHDGSKLTAEDVVYTFRRRDQ